MPIPAWPYAWSFASSRWRALLDLERAEGLRTGFDDRQQPAEAHKVEHPGGKAIARGHDCEVLVLVSIDPPLSRDQLVQHRRIDERRIRQVDDERLCWTLRTFSQLA